MSDPAIERQHEPALGPIEERRVEALQPDATQPRLAADGLVAPRIVQAVHSVEEDLIHQRHALLQRGGHAGRVVVPQEPLAQEQALLQHADRRERAPRARLLLEPRAERDGQAVHHGPIHVGGEERALEVGQEERVRELIQADEVVPAAQHIGQLGPPGLLRKCAVGRLQRGGHQAGPGLHRPARCPAQPPRPALQRRQITEGGVAAEQLIAAGPDQRHREPCLPDRPRHVIGVESVEGGLVEAVERLVQLADDLLLSEHHLAVSGADRLRDAPGDGALVVLRLLESQREGVDGAAVGLLREVRHRGRVDAAREEDSQRHVADQVHTQAFLEDSAEMILVHSVGLPGRRDGPEIPRHLLLSPAAVDAQRPRPEGLDAFDGGERADDEAVPHRRGGRLGAQPRCPQKTRGEQRAHLGGEGERPLRRRVRAARDVERLDAERVAREQKLSPLRVPAGEGEHPPQRRDRVGPPGRQRSQQHRRIPGGLEFLPRGDEAIAQLLEVVDLAVEDDHLAADGVRHRLRASRRDVEDGQPTMGKHGAEAAGVRRRFPSALAVGPAVHHRVAHPLESGAVGVADPPDDPGYPAHRLTPSLGSAAGSGASGGSPRLIID